MRATGGDILKYIAHEREIDIDFSTENVFDPEYAALHDLRNLSQGIQWFSRYSTSLCIKS